MPNFDRTMTRHKIFQRMRPLFATYPESVLQGDRALARDEINERIASGWLQFESLPCACCYGNAPRPVFVTDRYRVTLTTAICDMCGFLYQEPRMTKTALDWFYGSDIFRRLYHPNQKYEGKYLAACSRVPSRFDPHASYDAFGFLDYLQSLGIVFNSVFEVGAAGGANLVPAKRAGKDVAGVDLSPGMVDFAQEHGVEVRLGDVTNVPGGWDIYLIQHVLEHLYDPVGFLKHLHKVGAERLYIGVPGIITLMPSVQLAHNFYFSPGSLTEICRLAGYEPVDIDYYRENNYIVSVFRRSTNPIKTIYDPDREKRNVLHIVRTFKLKQKLISARDNLRLGNTSHGG